MAARGSVAKLNVTNKIAMCFGNDYILTKDNKIFLWANDGGERVQIALAMTCPKVQVEAPGVSTSEDHTDWDFEAISAFSEQPKPAKKAEVTQEEIDNIQKMMEKLGL